MRTTYQAIDFGDGYPVQVPVTHTPDPQDVAMGLIGLASWFVGVTDLYDADRTDLADQLEARWVD